MTNTEYINKLHKNEQEIIRFFNYHQIYDVNEYSDLIQDLYIKLFLLDNIDKYTYNDEPNMSFIFTVVRNMVYNISKKKTRKKYVRTENIEELEIEENETHSDGRCIQFIYDQIETYDNWFDKKVLEIYIKYGKTIRVISKETKISAHYIQPIIHNFKKKVQQSYNQQENNIINQKLR